MELCEFAYIIGKLAKEYPHIEIWEMADRDEYFLLTTSKGAIRLWADSWEWV